MSGTRRDAAEGALRQFEKCAGGVCTREALFRHRRPNHLVIQPIVRRPARHPSRSGHRQVIARGAFFRPTAAAPQTRCGSAAAVADVIRILNGFDDALLPR
jgi:hypothetical protein